MTAYADAIPRSNRAEQARELEDAALADLLLEGADPVQVELAADRYVQARARQREAQAALNAATRQALDPPSEGATVAATAIMRCIRRERSCAESLTVEIIEHYTGAEARREEARGALPLA